MNVRRLEFSLAKAEYLLHYTTTAGEGGDKRKFWHDILGFRSAAALRTTLLAIVAVDKLEPDGQNAYGDLYRILLPYPCQRAVYTELGQFGLSVLVKMLPALSLPIQNGGRSRYGKICAIRRGGVN